MNGKKWIAAGVLAATVMFGSMGSVSAAGEGYVNLPAVFASSPEAQQAGRTVAQAQQTLQAQFAKQSPGMSAQDKSALQQRLNQQLRDTQRDALGPVQKKIAQAIQTAAAKRDIDFVVTSGVVLYGGTDLTQDVEAALKSE